MLVRMHVQRPAVHSLLHSMQAGMPQLLASSSSSRGQLAV
jgi:hypothetical protein